MTRIAATLAELQELMAHHGIDHVIATYDGENDEGSVHRLEAFGPTDRSSPGREPIFEDPVVFGKPRMPCAVKDLAHDVANSVICEERPDWDDNHGSCGHMVLPSKGQRIHVCHNWRVIAYEDESFVHDCAAERPADAAAGAAANPGTT